MGERRGIAGVFTKLADLVERKVVNRYVVKKRGTPLTDAEWAKYSLADFKSPLGGTWLPYEEYREKRPENHASFVDWWLDQCEIPGPDGEKWSKT
jgi:hypothetical protein